MLSITPIPAFNDNYLWLITNGNHAAIVDPGDPRPVIQYLESNGLTLKAILITHHHADHTGGIDALKAQYHCPVYGPKNDPVSNLDHSLEENAIIKIESLGIEFQIIALPGHTLGHIAYYAGPEALGSNDATPLLFCGDTLFSGGCGRLFEGTPAQMWSSMLKIRNLPASTQVFPAHEYTQSNIDFALAVEPQNQDLIDYDQQVKKLRISDKPTLPTNLELETRINPFLRADIDSVKTAAESEANQELPEPVQVFAEIRRWKDHF